MPFDITVPDDLAELAEDPNADCVALAGAFVDLIRITPRRSPAVERRYCPTCGHRQDTGPIKHYDACVFATDADRYRDPQPPVLASRLSDPNGSLRF